jgi:hypothetical protein
MGWRMTYRLARSEEWPRIAEYLKDHEFVMPHPDGALCAIAEDESGAIAGCLFLMMVFHVEPLVLSSPAVSFLRLFKTIMQGIDAHKGLTFYAFSDTDKIDGMANLAGMTKTNYGVWKGQVT